MRGQRLPSLRRRLLLLRLPERVLLCHLRLVRRHRLRRSPVSRVWLRPQPPVPVARLVQRLFRRARVRLRLRLVRLQNRLRRALRLLLFLLLPRGHLHRLRHRKLLHLRFRLRVLRVPPFRLALVRLGQSAVRRHNSGRAFRHVLRLPVQFRSKVRRIFSVPLLPVQASVPRDRRRKAKDFRRVPVDLRVPVGRALARRKECVLLRPASGRADLRVRVRRRRAFRLVRAGRVREVPAARASQEFQKPSRASLSMRASPPLRPRASAR